MSMELFYKFSRIRKVGVRFNGPKNVSEIFFAIILSSYPLFYGYCKLEWFKYIKYTWFLTFTANQSEHPGLLYLHEWKNSMKWTKNIPSYKSFSTFEKNELKKAMEQAYGMQVYSNWNTVKFMFLKYIEQKCTILGTTTTIFARDKYQKDSGNLCHNHLILAIDKSNAKCNMSPIIVDFVVALKSMQNAQALDHTNRIAKYVSKYTGKFDDGNYVILCEDAHTREWILCETHLHNTKIVTSKINEDKAFNNERHKNHPKGRDMAHFETRQILMGHPEVFTDMEFIQISTSPFDLRQTNSIHLDIKDSVQYNQNMENRIHNTNPKDNYLTDPPMQHLRILNNLSEHQLMTPSQIGTYQNHDCGNSAKYDIISLFSLRPPELLNVFSNPTKYFRYCNIDDKISKMSYIEDELNIDISYCGWFDCLGRQVRICTLAFNDITSLCQKIYMITTQLMMKT